MDLSVLLYSSLRLQNKEPEGGQEPPLWSSGQSSWPQIQRSGFDFRRYQTFWQVMGLERGALSLVSTTEELVGKKSSGSGLEIREYDRRDLSCWPHGTLSPQKLALTLLTSGSHSVGIVHSRTQATELVSKLNIVEWWDDWWMGKVF
jgi:hypothetical protein